MRCGLEPLGPTTAQCISVNGHDWVLADPDADPVVFTTFGTDPAVDVAVPRSYDQPTGALVDLAPSPQPCRRTAAAAAEARPLVAPR